MLIGTVCTKKMVIKNCKVILQDRIRDNVDVIVKGDKILKIVSNINETYDTDVIDGKGRYLIPGYVDIHCHGSNGYDFMDNTLTAIKEICQYNIKNGVLSLVPTTLSSDLYELLEFLCIISKLDFNDMHFANIEGIHLEGPYFSLSNAGAQDKKYIHVPNQKEISKILNVTDKIIRWSVAPEIPNIDILIDQCKERNIMLSVAHTEANFQDIKYARDRGFTHFTHLYSGMKTIFYEKGLRKVGAVEAALFYDDLTVELIGDGIHIPYELFELIYKIKGADRIAIISDGMRATGTNVSRSILGSKKNGQQVVIDSDVAKSLTSGTLAGSVTPLSRMIKQIYHNTQIPLVDIIKMATAVPAKILGLRYKGAIMPGYFANLLLLNNDLDIEMVILRGKKLDVGVVE